MNELEKLHALLKEDWQEFEYYEGFTVVDTVEGDDRRWSRTVTVVLKSEESGKHYMWEYERGLTEYQDSEYRGDSPVEVVPVKKIVEVVEWVKA
jgi:hypothetical protein